MGHSDGGSIALIHASAFHDRVLALALEAPHVFVEPLTVASIAALSGQDDLRRRLERLHGPGTDETLRGWTDVWLRPEFRAWNLEPLLPAVACPVLVIQGEDDEFGTVRQVEAIARGVRGPVETRLLPTCGHSPHHQKREETLGLMIDFLRRHLPQDGRHPPRQRRPSAGRPGGGSGGTVAVLSGGRPPRVPRR